MTESTTSHDGKLVIYRCTDCGKTSVSIGWLHAHIEGKHYGFGPWDLIPDPRRVGNFQADMEKTEVLRVTDYETADVNEVSPA